MKKFNNWMLTNHPLIWNTRFHIMLPVVIVLNIVFFFWGYYQNITLKNVYQWRYQTPHLINGMAILIGFLILVVWLIFYLRQNAFKTLLPLSRLHLQKEFTLILIIIFGMASPMVVAHKGINAKVNRVGKPVNIEREKRIVRLAEHFLPFHLNEFSPQMVYMRDDRSDTPKIKEGMVPGTSYLNYRGRVYFEDERNQYSFADSVLDIKAIGWLKNHRKDSIITYVDKYLQLCKKYGGEYKFNSIKHVNTIFSTNDFLAAEEIPETEFYNDTLRYRTYIITQAIISNSINTILDAKTGLRWQEYFVLLMSSICLCWAIFSFRITPVKTWISAVVTAGLLTVGTVVLYAISKNDYVLLLSPILLGIVGFCISTILIFQKKRKYLAGVTYLLVLVIVPFL